jgi:transposase
MGETGGGGQTQQLFEVPPLTGISIGRHLRLVESDGRRAVLLGATPIFVYDVGDAATEKACIALLSQAGLAFDVDIAAAFGCHRNTVARLARQLGAGGLAAVVPAKRGPKGPSKATSEVLAVIAEHAGALTGRALVEVVAERTGVRLSVSHVLALAAEQRGRQLALLDDEQSEDEGAQPDGGAREAAADDGDIGGDADGQHSDRDDLAASDETAGGETDTGETVSGSGSAAVGLGFDPPVSLPHRVRGEYVGLALYYPALAALGLVEVARQVFALPRSERFGVRAVTLTLCFLTLLGKPTIEAAKHLRRRAFGAVVGSGRAPAVKTLRRKLAELVTQQQAGAFNTLLARRWVEGGIIPTAYLYVDGHVQAYHGKRRLQEVWNAKRRMPLPGVNTYHVADQAGRPLLFVTEPLSANLAKAMPDIIAAIRDVVGERDFTVVFDRGGLDGTLFAWLDGQGIGFITYQRGDPGLPKSAFRRRETRFEGRRVRFHIAEDEVTVGGSGPWRRVVVRTTTGHQTPILTNLSAQRVSAARIACLAFARWRQENLFKYMGQHHGLDQLVSYAAEPANADTLVPNPERKRLDRAIAARRRELAKLRAALGEALLDEPAQASRSAHGLKRAQGGAVGTLRALEADIDRLRAERKPLPTHVPLAAAGADREVMRLEAKHIIDRVKITAYNAEEWLLDRLVRHYPNRHDVRDLQRSFAALSGEIDTTDQGVIVTLDPPDTPAHRRALRGLAEDLNRLDVTYPGTDIPLTYQVAVHHSEAAA